MVPQKGLTSGTSQLSTDSDAGFDIIVCPPSRENPRNSEADVIELRDGRLLLAYTEFYGGDISDHAPARIVGKMSHDGGRTWSDRFTLVENTGSMNVMSASLIRLRTGELGMVYLRKNSLSDCRGFLRKSIHEGRTWSEPVCCTPLRVYHSVNNARVIRLRDDRILIPAAYTPDIGKRDYHLRSCCYYSDDNGTRWRKGMDVDIGGVGADEPAVVELKDGSVLMLIRTNLGRVYKAVSHDGGVVFSEPEPTDLAAPSSPSSVKRIPSARDLLVVWNNSTSRRVPLTVAISSDDGETWSHVKDLETQPTHREVSPSDGYAYTSITFIKDRVLFTYYVAGVPAEGVAGNNTWALKFRSMPVKWFYE